MEGLYGVHYIGHACFDSFVVCGGQGFLQQSVTRVASHAGTFPAEFTESIPARPLGFLVPLEGGDRAVHTGGGGVLATQPGPSGLTDHGPTVSGSELVVEGLRGELDCLCPLRLGCPMVWLVGLYELLGTFKLGFPGHYARGVTALVSRMAGRCCTGSPVAHDGLTHRGVRSHVLSAHFFALSVLHKLLFFVTKL